MIRKKSNDRPRQPQTFSPILESLEARDVPAVFTVTNTLDTGAGSLQQAITDANNTGGADDIAFNIPTADAGFNGTWWTITLQNGPLPTLTDSGTRILG